MMKEQKRRSLFGRILPFALAVSLIVTMTPVLGGAAEAAESGAAEKAAAQGEVEVTALPDVDLGEVDPEELELEGIGLEDLGLIEDPDGAGLAEGAPEVTAEAEDVSGESKPREAVIKRGAGAPTDEIGGIKLTPNRSNGELSVAGSISGDTFKNLYILDSSGNQVADGSTYVSGKRSFSFILDMSVLPVGEYCIYASTKGKRSYYDGARSEIYSVPANKASRYETYSKYLFFTPADTSYEKDNKCGLYLSIRKKGAKAWKTYGPLTEKSRIKGLKPSKTYQCRAFYRTNEKVMTNEGAYVYISGLDNKKYKTITVRTGKAKLPVKSVKVKAVSVKKYVHKRYGPATGLYLGKEIWYTYRLKVTVKMKKKPGVKGIYINGKRVKGNKKTYNVKFARVNSMMTGKHVVKRYSKWWKQDDIYKIPRGTKYKVMIYGYSNKTYKAYSPIQKKTARIK